MKSLLLSAALIAMASQAPAVTLILGGGTLNAASTSDSAGVAATGAAGAGGVNGGSVAVSNNANDSTATAGLQVLPVPSGLLINAPTSTSSNNSSTSVVLSAGAGAGIAAGFATGAGVADAGAVGAVLTADILP